MLLTQRKRNTIMGEHFLVNPREGRLTSNRIESFARPLPGWICISCLAVYTLLKNYYFNLYLPRTPAHLHTVPQGVTILFCSFVSLTAFPRPFSLFKSCRYYGHSLILKFCCQQRLLNRGVPSGSGPFPTNYSL